MNIQEMLLFKSEFEKVAGGYVMDFIKNLKLKKTFKKGVERSESKLKNFSYEPMSPERSRKILATLKNKDSRMSAYNRL